MLGVVSSMFKTQKWKLIALGLVTLLVAIIGGGLLFGQYFTQTKVTALVQYSDLIGYKVDRNFRLPWQDAIVYDEINKIWGHYFPEGDWQIYETIDLSIDNIQKALDALPDNGTITIISPPYSYEPVGFIETYSINQTILDVERGGNDRK